MTIRIMASRHSAFYSPLLIAVHFLREAGHDTHYSVLAPGQKTSELLRDGAADIIQSAVSSNWKLLERGIGPLLAHFAQINCRDGFFLVGTDPDPQFTWKKLEGSTVSADPGEQPLAMLKYALKHNGVNWNRITMVPDGAAQSTHQQAPVTGGEIVASVGASMPPVAFSSVCCARAFLGSAPQEVFLEAFRRAREWTRIAPAGKVAATESRFFPGCSLERLEESIRRYQNLGCWDGDIGIPRDLYEQALDVFQSSGGITVRHPYEDVVASNAL